MAIATDTKNKVDSPRLVLYVEDVENVELQRVGEALSKLVGRQTSKEWQFEKIDELSEKKSLNTVTVSKFTVDKEKSYLVKLITAPDADSVYFPVVLAKYPNLSQDASLALPKIVDIVNAVTQETKYYIHISPWINHIGSLADLTVTFWMTKRVEPIVSLYTAFGQYLQMFQTTYPGLRHNDVNPANILIQPVDGSFGFVVVDCAGMDDEVGDDEQSFLKSIDVLAEGGFGDEFKKLAIDAFESGYKRH